jgi:hypothetical protein
MTYYEFKRMLSFSNESIGIEEADLASCFLLSKMMVIDEVEDAVKNKLLSLFDIQSDFGTFWVCRLLYHFNHITTDFEQLPHVRRFS